MSSTYSSSEETTGWVSTTASEKAWMSVRDADLLENFLLRLASFRDARPLRILEWGSGRSTLWFGRLFDACKIDHHWLGIEHNSEYFNMEISDEFLKSPIAKVVQACNKAGASPHKWSNTSERLITLFDHGPIAPFDTKLLSDRLVNMDAYVDLPAIWGFEPDVVIVDGRKRRRCLLEAQKLVGKNGFVILHDAWREHYQCAWEAFEVHRRIGDELWIGMNKQQDLSMLLPWHAFDKHGYYDEGKL